MQESLVVSKASWYLVVVQRAPQMVSSLRMAEELTIHTELSGVDLNYKYSNSNSSDDEDSDLNSGICQAGSSKQESRTKSVVHASSDDSLDCQTPAMKPSSDFFYVVDLSLRVELSWMLGIWASIMNRSLLSLQMVLRNQRPVLRPWNKLLLVLP